MDLHTDMVEPATPVLSCDNIRFWRTEDSGYHTFTPGSIDCSELSNDYIEPAGIQGSIHRGKENHHKFYTPEPCHDQSHFTESNENFQDLPKRRGVKRPYQDDLEPNDVSYGSIATPTSIIAGQIQKLKVNDSAHFSGNYSISPISSEYADASSIYSFNAYSLSFPSTPVKRVCKSSCKLNRLKSSNKSSPLRPINNLNNAPKRFARHLDFETHSLACEPQSLQAVPHPLPNASPAPVLYKPNQRIDIIKLLSKTVVCVPAIEKILSYMTPFDTFHFSLVSPTWCQVCKDVPHATEKLKTYYRLSKENQENKRKSTPIVNTDIRRKLKDIHNIEHVQITRSLSSPPGSPRSQRFKMFARSASMDTRIQLACVRCQQPAKVTQDPTGEVWAECTRVTCAYQFCKLCSCDRHPGKSCIRFDLEGPSPSKRKKKTCAAGSRQSKTNLRRLLIK